jgi:hypothetical protein
MPHCTLAWLIVIWTAHLKFDLTLLMWCDAQCVRVCEADLTVPKPPQNYAVTSAARDAGHSSPAHGLGPRPQTAEGNHDLMWGF